LHPAWLETFKCFLRHKDLALNGSSDHAGPQGIRPHDPRCLRGEPGQHLNRSTDGKVPFSGLSRDFAGLDQYACPTQAENGKRPQPHVWDRGLCIWRMRPEGGAHRLCCRNRVLLNLPESLSWHRGRISDWPGLHRQAIARIFSLR